ncbi:MULTISPECIES: BREX-1 system adenine-specific DNA-methyltransferase PglX [Flavobacterium]|uniref:BREX-1 system adenine-specific DNA-methyltransferase PglX n=1 Tax=Flavobacterium TaxID=237 RepID=UPI001FCCBF8D|nr:MULTISPECIES: BREX-1 system adenine-specific DNA-methyltransferase PglX [Flavobacterium]UOK42518.1 BREX-1 system adenine-specific DNA-methyltransferase PglX [Flavobacterium enshiense]
MNTNNIKSFAKQARLILMEGVKQRLTYWGFAADGTCTENLETTTGGYIFRGQVFNDDSVPPKWQKLKAKLTNKQAVQDTIEEAAYTWFNRLMAINILEKRGYIQPTLTFVAELKTPQIVQNAKRGQHQLKQEKYVNLLQQYLIDDQEEQALGLLLTRLCNNNIPLHDVFGHIDDYTEILLPNNLLQRNGIIDLLNSDIITNIEYKEVELIGWLYQFYISDKKDEVFKGFKANKKARPEDIPAATQIFTPKWIVKYMVENTVGKIYLDFDNTSSLKPEMKYLVVNEAEEKINYSPFTIHHLEDLTLIDPASGSGHILVTGFELLFKMYREQGYTAKNAVISILQNNLFGLDIDDRAMQLARFAVLLKAAEFYPEVLNPSDSTALLLPHIYSFPETYHFNLEEIQSFLTPKGASFVAELKGALVLLNEGKNIGTALKLELSPEAHTFIAEQYRNWNTQYQAGTLDIIQQDLWNNLKPFLEVLLVMTKKYTAVVANPPYMGQKNMNAKLKDYVNDNYPLSKSDLFAVFMEVCLSMNVPKGLMGMINQHSWMFLSSYEKLREHINDNFGILNMLHLGPRTFEELSGEVVQSTAFVLENGIGIKSGNYFRLVDYRNNIEKEDNFLNRNNQYSNVLQENFEKILGSPIAYWVSEREKDLFNNGSYFSKECYPKKGIDTGENEYFLKFWFEINLNKASLKLFIKDKKWYPYNKGGEFRRWYGNRENLVNWENCGEEIKSRLSWKSKKPTIRNSKYHFLEGFSWSTISSAGFSCRYVPEGCLFDNGGCTLFADKELYFFGAMLNTKVANRYLKFLSPTLNFQPGDIGRMLYYPPNKNYESVETITKELISNSKKDWDSRETSWDFEQSPLLNESPSLKNAYQKWEENATNDFFQLHSNEEELNRIFIDIYGLQEELTPEVALKDITILQEELDSKALEQLEPVFRAKDADSVALPIKKDDVISQFLSYCIGVFMGRYRLDKTGLHIAHPKPTEDETSNYAYNGSTIAIDDDAIIPLMGSECAFPDDALVRIKNLIHDLWGEDTLTENLNFINECLGSDLDKWLTEKFYGYHTGMYKKKPIYWLFCSNPKKPQASAFKVLTYMHRMDKYTVSKIQRNYLHPHQEWIKHEIEKAVANESNLSKNELKRLEKLRSWELECRDYNEVLKTLALNEIVFDLDDGVSVNYEKFEGAVAKI